MLDKARAYWQLPARPYVGIIKEVLNSKSLGLDFYAKGCLQAWLTGALWTKSRLCRAGYVLC